MTAVKKVQETPEHMVNSKSCLITQKAYFLSSLYLSLLRKEAWWQFIFLASNKFLKCMA